VATVKTIPAILATAVAAVLLFSPLMASAAGSVNFTSPAIGTSLKGTATLSIAGTVSPAPNQADSVFLTIGNPSGTTVWADIATVNPTTGAFTDSAQLGGSSYSASGVYKLTATDSFSATGSVSFTYTAPTSGYNQTRALINIQGNLSLIFQQLKNIQGNLTQHNAAEAVEQKDMKGNFSALSSAISSLSTAVSTLSTTVGNIQNSLTSLSSTVSSINTGVTNLGTQVAAATTAAQNAASAVSSTQTYVLVVAVLAAITLVLELAILVRKLS
jgi:hypothetical protein